MRAASTQKACSSSLYLWFLDCGSSQKAWVPGCYSSSKLADFKLAKMQASRWQKLAVSRRWLGLGRFDLVDGAVDLHLQKLSAR
jgi:hypothetical protein